MNSCHNGDLSFQGIVDAHILKTVPEEAQIMTSFVVNETLFWLVTDVLEIAAGVSLKWDPTSITLAQIKKKIEALQEDMQVLLNTDFKAAFQYLGYAAFALKNEDYESAYSELSKVKEYSIRAYSQMKTFRKKVFCKKMTIFSMHMIQCYNKDRQSFDHLLTLPIKKQKSLAESVQSDVDIILEEFEKIEKNPNWWQRKVHKVKSKSEEQDVLDGLLKAALPIIWHHHDLFKVKGHNDKEMLKYLPDGCEDGSEILLEGKWLIRVWRDGLQQLSFEFQELKIVDERIRRTSFHCISSDPYCKYFKKVWLSSYVLQDHLNNVFHFSGSKLKVEISKNSPPWNYHEEFISDNYIIQDELKNHCKYWKHDCKDLAIWFSNPFWMIGDVKDIESETCVIKAKGSSDEWPTDLEGKWFYWNPGSKEWMKAGNDVKVDFSCSLPYNKQSIE